jgi:hypothetical protein
MRCYKNIKMILLKGKKSDLFHKKKVVVVALFANIIINVISVHIIFCRCFSAAFLFNEKKSNSRFSFDKNIYVCVYVSFFLSENLHFALLSRVIENHSIT